MPINTQMTLSTTTMRVPPCWTPMEDPISPRPAWKSSHLAAFSLLNEYHPCTSIHCSSLHIHHHNALTCVERPAIWLRLASSRRDGRVSWPMKWHQCKSAVSVLLPLLFYSRPASQQVRAPSLSRPFNHFHLCQLPFSHHTRFDVPADLHPLCVQPRSALRHAV